jgi:P4 family phage/plasmid primase-like protien
MLRDLDQTITYLEALGLDAQTPVMWRCIWREKKGPDGGRLPSHLRPRIIRGSLDENVDKLTDLNVKGWGVYMQVHAGMGTKAKEITDVRALFVDNDFGDLPSTWPAGATPDLIVESGRGQHAYWAVASEGEEGLKHLKTRQVALATVMNTDPAVCDLSRVMRVPGFMWTKPDDRDAWRMVTCLDTDTGVGTTRAARDVVAALTSPPKPPDADWAMYKVGCLASAIRAAPPGTSQNTFNRCAFEAKDYLRHVDGVDLDAVRSILFSAAEDRGVDGVESTWESALNAEGSASWAGVAPTDGDGDTAATGLVFPSGHEEDIARTLLDEWNDVVAVGGALYVYDPSTGVWESYTDSELRGQIAQYHHTPYVTAAGKPGFLKVGIGLRTKVAQAMLEVPSIQRSSMVLPPGIGFRNGFLTPDGVLHPHAPGNFCVVRYDWDWTGPCGALPSSWARFLDGVWADVGEVERSMRAAAVGTLIGASVLGTAPGYARVMILTGGGANGKSVFLDAVRHAVGEPLTTFVHPEEWGREYYRMGLRPPARINIVPELPDSEWFAPHQFKGIVSGDEIAARHPSERSVKFHPQCGHIMSCNELPTSADRSDGFWRRISVVPFNVTFTGDKRRPAHEIHAELARERRDFLAWAIGWGLAAGQLGDLVICGDGENVKAEWKKENDPVAQWLEECTEPSNRHTAANELYTSFGVWSASNGHRLKSATWWGRQMRRLGIEKAHTMKGNVYWITVK